MDHALKTGIQTQKVQRNIGFYTQGSCFGFEELCRDFLICHKENIKFTKAMAGKRDFTCIVDTSTASVLHLNLEIVAPIL